MVFIPIFQWYLHYPLVAVNTYYPLDHVNVWIMWNIPGFPWRFHTDPNIYHRRPPTAPAKVCMAPMFPSHEGLPGCLDGVLKRKTGQIMPDYARFLRDFWEKMSDYARLCQMFGKNVRFCQIWGSWFSVWWEMCWSEWDFTGLQWTHPLQRKEKHLWINGY